MPGQLQYPCVGPSQSEDLQGRNGVYGHSDVLQGCSDVQDHSGSVQGHQAGLQGRDSVQDYSYILQGYSGQYYSGGRQGRDSVQGHPGAVQGHNKVQGRELAADGRGAVDMLFDTLYGLSPSSQSDTASLTSPRSFPTSPYVPSHNPHTHRPNVDQVSDDATDLIANDFSAALPVSGSLHEER